MKIIQQVKYPDCIRTNYQDDCGKEWWHTLFINPEHPVNKLWRLSGAER